MPHTATGKPFRAPQAADPLGVAPRGVVLVVDPDAGMRRMMAMVLFGSPCVVIAVADAEGALDVARSERPCVVVAEARLPGMSGSELARALRVQGLPVPRIVLMSAYPRPPRDAEDEFLQKPLRIERLLAIVAEAVEGA